MHWALAVPVAILVAGVLACLAMHREAGPASTAVSAATSMAVQPNQRTCGESANLMT